MWGHANAAARGRVAERGRVAAGSSGPALTAANADAGAALAVQAQQTMQRNQLQQID